MNFFETLWQWNLETSNWLWVLSVVVCALLISYCFKLLDDPRRLERAVARTLERQKVADIVSAALQDAAHAKKITADQWHKYNKKLAHSLGLPDMEPKKRVDANKTKLLVKQRLVAMGVNISEKLRRQQTNKIAKLNLKRK